MLVRTNRVSSPPAATEEAEALVPLKVRVPDCPLREQARQTVLDNQSCVQELPRSSTANLTGHQEEQTIVSYSQGPLHRRKPRTGSSETERLAERSMERFVLLTLRGRTGCLTVTQQNQETRQRQELLEQVRTSVPIAAEPGR